MIGDKRSAGPAAPSRRDGGNATHGDTSLKARASRVRRIETVSDADTSEGPIAELDAICRLARTIFTIDAVAIWLAEENVKDPGGFAGTAFSAQIQHVEAFFAKTCQEDAPLIVEDAMADFLTRDEIFVVEGGLRFYVRAPLIAASGKRVGTVSLLDRMAQTFPPAHLSSLADLAVIAASQIALRRARGSPIRNPARRVAADSLEREMVAREAQLRAPMDYFEMAELLASAGHSRIDLKTGRREFSEGMRRIFGLAAHEPVPTVQSVANGYHPDDRAKVLAAFSAALRDGKAFDIDTRVQRPDGTVREVILRSMFGKDPDGRASSLLEVCIDVTELHEARRRLQDSESNFSLLVGSVTDYSIYMLGLDGRIANWNVGAQRIKGYTAAEVVGRHFRCFFTPEDQAAGLPEHLLDEVRLKGGHRSEGWRVRKDGRRIWTSVVLSAVRNGVGELIGYGKVTRDMTVPRMAEIELRESEARYRLLAENVTDLIVMAGPDFRWHFISPACSEILGYRPEVLMGRRPCEFVHPEDSVSQESVIAGLADGTIERTVVRLRYLHRSGRTVWLEGVFRVIREEGVGQPNGYVASLRDIGARKAVEDELQEKSMLLDQTFESMDQGLVMTDAAGIVRVANRRAAELLGTDEKTLRARPLLEHLLSGCVQLPESAWRRRETVRTSSIPIEVVAISSRLGGVLEMRRVALHTGSEVVTFTDITDRAQAERRIEHMAMHDQMTGLPNRRAFRERLDAIFADREGRSGATILSLDLDRFKTVNDTLGHGAGDGVLKVVAKRLRHVLRPSDFAARIGGDEFAVLFESAKSRRSVEGIARRILSQLAQPATLEDGMRVAMGVSIGIASVGPDALTAESLLQNADLALYRAKALGRNQHVFYTRALDRDTEDRRRVEMELCGALASNQMRLDFQPCVEIATGRTIGFEALLRWHHPERGLVAPSTFVPIAEENGAIVAIGEWVIREACRVASAWPQDIRIAVNVSAAQFLSGDLENIVISACEHSGLKPQRLELEVTESLLLQDTDALLAMLGRLRKMGVRMALDDFGTGYSSLSYLHRIPFDKIKIDRSFIERIEDRDIAAVVAAIVNIGRGRPVTAEGVETEQQLKLVAELGCTEVQGYLFSRPLPEQDCARMFEKSFGRI